MPQIPVPPLPISGPQALTTVTREYELSFETFTLLNKWMTADRPDPFDDANTYWDGGYGAPNSPPGAIRILTNDPVSPCRGAIPSLNGIPGDWRRIELPALPATAGNVTFTVTWASVAHTIYKTETINSSGNLTLNEERVWIGLGFPQGIPASGTALGVMDCDKRGTNPSALSPVALAGYDGVLDYLGPSSNTHVRRTMLAGAVALGAGPSGGNGFQLSDLTGGYGSWIHVWPVLAVEAPQKTYSGTATDLRSADVIFASGSFKVTITYTI